MNKNLQIIYIYIDDHDKCHSYGIYQFFGDVLATLMFGFDFSGITGCCF